MSEFKVSLILLTPIKKYSYYTGQISARLKRWHAESDQVVIAEITLAQTWLRWVL